MNRRLVLFASLVIAVVAFCSCDDDVRNATGGTQVISMPNSVGMLWVYEVYDSLTQTTDTVSVSITDAVVEGLRWRVFWQVGDSVSERIAVVRGDTLDFIIDTNFIAPPLERFVFPLSLGSQWSTSSGTDSSFITDINTVSIRAGTFMSSALVERIWNFGIEGGHDSSMTWVAPNVGIVSRYFYGTIADGGGNLTVYKNQTWELIEFDLSTFSMNQFPGANGSEWTYEIVDSRLNVPDTVTVSIANSVQIAGFDSTKMWLVQSIPIAFGIDITILPPPDAGLLSSPQEYKATAPITRPANSIRFLIIFPSLTQGASTINQPP